MHSPPSQAPWNRVEAGAVKKSVLWSSQSSSFSLPGRVMCCCQICEKLFAAGPCLQLQIVQKALEDGHFVVAQGNALAHAGAVRGPVADVVPWVRRRSS